MNLPPRPTLYRPILDKFKVEAQGMKFIATHDGLVLAEERELPNGTPCKTVIVKTWQEIADLMKGQARLL